MKNWFTLLVFILPLFAIGQTQEDFVNCLNQVLASQKFEPYLIQQEQEFGEVIITRKERQSINADRNRFRWTTLQSTDFEDAPFRVNVLNKKALNSRVRNKHLLINWTVEGNYQNLSIFATIQRNEQPRWIRAQFFFVKNDEEWEITNEIINESSR